MRRLSRTDVNLRIISSYREPLHTPICSRSHCPHSLSGRFSVPFDLPRCNGISFPVCNKKSPCCMSYATGAMYRGTTLILYSVSYETSLTRNHVCTSCFSRKKIRHSCSRAKSDILIFPRLSATAGSLSENTNHTLYPIIAFRGMYL